MWKLGQAAFLLLLWPLICAAQEYPLQPVRIVVGFSAGSGLDVTTRMIGQRLADSWGQPVVVDNRTGAAGTIAADIVAKATPDGYTLLNVATAHVISASLYPKLPYDFVKDLAPITRIGTSPYLMAVNLTVPARSVKDLIALAKSRPGTINYGSSGNGTVAHLAGEMLKAQAGISMVHIPYKGSPQVVTDLLAGQIDMMFNTVAVLLPYVKSGRLRGLGVASTKRTVWLPEISTLAESGLPGFEAESWHGFATPAGTPQSVINKLYRDIAKIVENTEMRERLLALGLEPAVPAPTPAEFGSFIKREIIRYASGIRTSGASAQ